MRTQGVPSSSRRRCLRKRLINFMLFELGHKLSAIGRLDTLDDVVKKAQDYLQKLPKDVITKWRQHQQWAVLLNLGDIYRLRGNLEKHLQHINKAWKSSEDPLTKTLRIATGRATSRAATREWATFCMIRAIWQARLTVIASP